LGAQHRGQPTLRELGIGLVPYSPLGRGFLTGNAKRAEELPADDWRAKGDPRLQGKNFDENMKLAELVRQFAEEKSATPRQVALAWLLRKVSGSRYNPADLAAINR
jgi:aryl-alcohol dehydrogenase-like predicted oxidoreductase